MKKVRMMYLKGCPHCKNAFSMIEKLKEEHPEYKAIEIETIEEQEHADIANSLDYYYVPTYFVDGKKIHEGVPTLEKLAAVLNEAL